MNLQQQLDELALLMEERNAVTKIANEAREAWEAEYSEMLTQEKRLKLAVERKKEEIRQSCEISLHEDGERPSAVGISMAKLDVVEVTNEQKLVEFCAINAPELLTLVGKQMLKDWIFSRGTPARVSDGIWDVLWENRSTKVIMRVPGVRVIKKPSFRIEEKAVLTEFDRIRWEASRDK